MLDRALQGDAAEVDAAGAVFAQRYPDFDPDGSFADLRRREYGRLDDSGSVYVDYTGGGLYAAAQLAGHVAHLGGSVLGNPHSGSNASRASTHGVDRARAAVLAFFGADPCEYTCVFTANASAALKLVAESYPFGRGGVFALTADNHNSVNGIRELAARAGAAVEYAPILAPELRVDRAALHRILSTRQPSAAPRLLAFPAQSNYSGVQHPLELVAEAHEHGWDVLLDASAFAPTNRLDLGAVRPDFVAASFYKIFGYPTGVGCLLARHDRLSALARPWFAGGTVEIASVGLRRHVLHDGPAGFEDGTVDYLSLPAVTSGLAHVESIGRDAIHDRVGALTAWFLDQLAVLRHRDGRPLVRILGPRTTQGRGATVAFMVHEPDGRAIDGQLIESLANERGISLRSGCFCNPGAAEAALGIDVDVLVPWFDRRATAAELHAGMRERGQVLAAVRVSFGLASNFADVYHLVRFLEDFVDADSAAPTDSPIAVPA